MDDFKHQKEAKGSAYSLAESAFLNVQKTADYLMRQVAETLKPFQITPPQYNVLRILSKEKDGMINREIGEAMLTFVPDVTRMLDRLEARNLICRERGIEDRRLVTTCITPEGEKLLAQLEEVVEQFHQNILGSCEDKEIQKLVEILEKLRAEKFGDSTKF